MDTWILVLLAVSIVLEIVLLVAVVFSRSRRELFARLRAANQKDFADLRLELAKDSAEEQTMITQTMEQSLSAMERNLSAGERVFQENMLRQSMETQNLILKELTNSVQTMTAANNERLAEIQREMREKLDRSLSERLDQSFDRIGKQLSELYKTVGELQTLTTGVESLNRTLANVKTRGTWGEMQLEQILRNIFPDNLYEKNVQVKRGSQERVEFALRIPDKTDGDHTIYLPIDSKFPADIYQKIQDAAEKADQRALESAVLELKTRIRNEARDISSKYIAPPATTDFAIMFLPTEGLYAEVLRIPGLAEAVQSEQKVMIAGPATISALLSSLAVGFRFLTVSRNTHKVLSVLQNIRGQYGKLGELIDTAQKNLDRAVTATENMKKRTDMINARLQGLRELADGESAELPTLIEAEE